LSLSASPRIIKCLTLEQFVGTRTFHANIEHADRADPFGEIVPGYVYECGLYIEQRLNGAFYLCIEQAEYESRDLLALERKLYEYGVTGGYFTSPEAKESDMKKHLRAITARLVPPTITMEPQGRLLHVQPASLQLSTAETLKVAIAVLDAAAGKCEMFSPEWQHCSAAAATLMAIEAQRGGLEAGYEEDKLTDLIDVIVFG
jgi:hypothetical protein